MNNNPDPQAYLNDLDNKIKNKDFSSPPDFNNGLDEKNIKISKDNLEILQKLSKIAKYTPISPLEIIYKEQYGIFTKTTTEREKCSICLEEFYGKIINDKSIDLKDLSSYEIDTVKLFRCKDHFYHIECLSYYAEKQNGFKCSVCQKLYGGVMIGDMPPGTMSVRVDDKLKCSGYPDNGTITIYYNFKDGNINGTKYTGTSRYCYLPNTQKGRILLALLEIAFERKLSFTVGTSVTTGQKNCVVWNGIHHKTNTSGGATKYGYPDPTYFDRLCDELEAKGINREDYDDKELEFYALCKMYGQ